VVTVVLLKIQTILMQFDLAFCLVRNQLQLEIVRSERKTTNLKQKTTGIIKQDYRFFAVILVRVPVILCGIAWIQIM
jgi:hypothetical protein